MAPVVQGVAGKRTAARWSLARKEAVQGYLYVTPWIIGFVVFTLGPMLVSFLLSLSNYKMLKFPRLVGFENYINVFQEPLFWKSLENTLYYAFIFVPLNLIGSLFCAILLNQDIKGRAFFRSVYFLPSITPTVASALLWMYIFQPQVGLLNYLLGQVGIAPGPGWLGNPLWSKPALIIISLWGAVGGGTMLIFLAGLQGVPREMYEAAAIDGAGRWAQFWRVTLPLLSPSMFFNLVLGLIGAFQQFTLAFVATSGGGQQRTAGGPLYSTLFYVLNLYNHAFDFWEMGYACALAWVFFVLVLGLTFIQLRFARNWVYYEGQVGETKW